jgi:hypothetical protein
MRYIFAILICLFSLSVSAQDQIQIRNLGTVNGQITSFTRDHVFLKMDTSTKKLRYDVIEAIKMKDPDRLRSEIVLYRSASLLVYGRYVNLTFAEQLKMDSITKATLADNKSNLPNNTVITYDDKKYWNSSNYLYEAGRMEHKSFWLSFGGLLAGGTSALLVGNGNNDAALIVGGVGSALLTASVVCKFKVGTYLKFAGARATEKLSFNIKPTSLGLAMTF